MTTLNIRSPWLSNPPFRGQYKRVCSRNSSQPKSRQFTRFRPLTPISMNDNNNYEFEKYDDLLIDSSKINSLLFPLPKPDNIVYPSRISSPSFKLTCKRPKPNSDNFICGSGLDQQSNKSTIATAQREKRKCTPVYLGSGKDLYSTCPVYGSVCCSRMRCTSCNFIVLRFEGEYLHRLQH